MRRKAERGRNRSRVGALLLATVLAALLAGGCDGVPKPDVPSRDAPAAFVEALGYDILEDRGTIHSYVFESARFTDKFAAYPTMILWGVQRVKPEPYLGKLLEFHQFLVGGHPLATRYDDADTVVNVIVCEGDIIGGTSFPDIEGLMGAAYSIDGKTLEEMTGLSYEEFRNQWVETYGERERE
ncbi:hypothetical protein MO973_42555 [Paenibacillus sp. TRM 82003]|nr:hypothetical protein [Paenibacillus sp. TRM 82003]